MLKSWLTLRLLAACQLVLAFVLLTGEIRAEILFLNLRRDATGITLLSSQAERGELKGQSSDGPIAFEITNSEGAMVHNGRMADPLFERFEYPDAPETGVLRAGVAAHESAEFTMRVPGSAAGQMLRFVRTKDPANVDLRAAASETLGELRIPLKPSVPLRALATGARMHTLLTNGLTSARLNIVVLAEGFTAGEETAFTNRARIIVNQFLATSPYNDYRTHFNAFAIFVPSAESGSDHPSRGTSRNTYFNSSYGTGGLERLITIPPNSWNTSYSAGMGKVYSLLQQFVPDFDIALLIVNDSEYGGAGGSVAIASINTSSTEIAVHEIGHSFANLGDEYDAEYPGYPNVEEPNTTRQTNRDAIKWRDWIKSSTPIPTPETALYANTVGLFEGAHYHATGWYRPQLDCRMQTLGQEFCSVCKEAIVISTYSRLGIIRDSTPAENNITVLSGEEITLSVETIDPPRHNLEFVWSIDGATNFSYNGATFPASVQTLGLGSHLVRVSVFDPTPLVRTDGFGSLWKTRNWLVNVSDATNQPPMISPIANVFAVPGEVVRIVFNLTDVDSPPDALQLGLEFSSTNILSTDDFHFEGSGTNRTLFVPTRCDGIGTTRLTLIARDELNSTSVSFDVEVQPAQGPPLALSSIVDQRLFRGPLDIPVHISFTGCEREFQVSAISSDTVLVPDESITITGTGANRLLHIVPPSGSTGMAEITVRVSDGENQTVTTFKIDLLETPVARAENPVRTASGLSLRFTCEPASSMVLEFSRDFRSWTTLTSSTNATSLEYFLPISTFEEEGFFRLRLLPL